MYLASKSVEGSRMMVGQKEGRRKQTGRMSWASVAGGGGDLVVQQMVMTTLGWEGELDGQEHKARKTK